LTASGTAAPPAALALSGRQLDLYGALADRSERLASMYYGALLVRDSGGNPDRFALAAHGMRELMEKLPAYLDVAMPAHAETLKRKVQEVEDAWNHVVNSSGWSSPQNAWQGSIDCRLRKFLAKLDSFFCWFRNHMPRRREEVSAVLRTIDPANRQLPRLLEERNVATWNEMRQFFQSVAHHGKTPAQVDFDKSVETLERFLLERLAPRTFDDFAEIDAILGTSETKNA
jgi:hypothetical protein